MKGVTIPGFSYTTGKPLEVRVQECQTLERAGFRRQVDAAKGETWYRAPGSDRLAVEVYAIIPAARAAAQETQS